MDAASKSKNPSVPPEKESAQPTCSCRELLAAVVAAIGEIASNSFYPDRFMRPIVAKTFAARMGYLSDRIKRGDPV